MSDARIQFIQTLLDIWCRMRRILIIGHSGCGDGLASLIGLSSLFSLKGISHNNFFPGTMPSFGNAPFFQRSEKIFTDKSQISWSLYDHIILVDIADISLTGCVEELHTFVQNGNTITTIDHHASHQPFGTFQWYETQWGSCSMMIGKIWESAQLSYDAQTATALLFGLMYDTGDFSNGGTSAELFRFATKLLQSGAQRKQALEYSHPQFLSEQVIEQWATVLTTSKIKDDSVEIYLPRGVSLSNAINSISKWFAFGHEGLNVLHVWRHKGEGKNLKRKGSFRTTCNDIDVGARAMKWGGGGHRQAAGYVCSEKSSLQQ